MIRRKDSARLCAVLVSPLLLALACTDNAPSRVLEQRTSAGGSGMTGTAGKGSSNAGTSAGGSGPSTSGTSSGGADAGAAGAGGAEADPCLPACDDPAGCELTPEQQLMADFCRFYALHCPDQPADVLVPRGPGTPLPAGPAAPSTPTRPQLSQAVADELYSIDEALRGGGEYSASYAAGSGGEGGGGPLGERTVSYASEGDWDPRAPIEDVTKIVPGLVVDPQGDPKQPGMYQTLQSAIGDAVLVAGCPRVFIQVKPGTYHEKVTLPAKTSAPPITIYSADRDPSRVVIVAGHSAAGAEDDGTPLTVQQSATFTNSLPQLFQARNLTIANNYVAGTYAGAPEAQTAVALLSQADRALFDNVRILGHRNTIYVKSTAANEVSRAYFRDCYVEGDEDIILGRGAAVFDQCRIHSLGDRVSAGAVTAASTRVDNPHGLLIINSELTADARVSNVYLGHQWYEGDTQEAVGKAIVRNSKLGQHIRAADAWAPSVRVTPKSPTATSTVLYTSDDYYAPATGLFPPEIYLAEFGNSGPGAAQ
jgi:pectinesterase